MNAYREQQYLEKLKELQKMYSFTQLDEEIQRVEDIVNNALKEYNSYVGRKCTYKSIITKKVRPAVITKICHFSTRGVVVRIEYDNLGFDIVWIDELVFAK